MIKEFDDGTALIHKVRAAGKRKRLLANAVAFVLGGAAIMAALAVASLLSCTPHAMQPERVSSQQAALVSAPLVVACAVGGGAPPGAVCLQAAVSCPGAPTVQIRVAVSSPAGHTVTQRAPLGTIVSFSGGTGGGYTAELSGPISTWTAAGYKVAQVSFLTAWQDVPSHSILTASCRVTEVLSWARSYLHATAQSNGRGFCGLGSSGGASALTYATGLDAAVLVNGGPLNAMSYGCDPYLYSATGRIPSLCGVDDTMGYPGTMAAAVAGWEAVTCAAPLHDGDRTKLDADSKLFSPSSPAPSVVLVRCSGAVTAAGLLTPWLTAVGGSTVCTPCSGEGVLTNATALDSVTSEMLARCHGG